MNGRRLLLALGSLLLLALLLALVLSGEPGAGPLTSTETPALAPDEAVAPVHLDPLVAASLSGDEEATGAERETVGEEIGSEEGPAPPGVNRVVDPRGRALPGARVAVLRLGPDGPLAADAAATRVAGPDGRFALDPAGLPAGEVLAVVARSAGLRPATVQLASREAWPAEGLVLQLEQGASLVGRVLRAGQGVGQVQLVADLFFGVPGVHVPRSGELGSEAFWLAGRLEEKVATGRSEADGSFEFTGLAPGVHDLHVRPPGPCLPEFLQLRAATDEELVVELPSAELELALLDGGAAVAGRAVAGARVDLTQGTSTLSLWSEEQPLRVHVPAGAPVDVLVVHPGYARLERSLTGPGAGERERVELLLEAVPRPVLRLWLPGAASAGVDDVRVQVRPRTGGELLQMAATRSSGQDLFEIDPLGVDPGTYLVRVGAGGLLPSRFVRTVQREVEVPREGVVEVQLELLLDGRLEVHPSSPLAGEWWADVRVLDAAGNVVLERTVQHVRWEGPEGGLVSYTEMVQGSEEEGAPPPIDDAVLPPGSYRVRVESPDHEPLERSVVVESGKETVVELELVPLDGR